MNKKTLISLFTLGLTTIAPSAYAHENCAQFKHHRESEHRQHKMHKMQQRIAEKLNLTEEQQTQWQDLQQSQQNERQTLHKKSRELRQSIYQAEQEQPQNNQQIQSLAQQLGALKTQQILLHNKHKQAIAKLLTEEQQQQWQNMKKRFRHN